MINSLEAVKQKIDNNLTDPSGIFTEVFEHLKISQGKYARTQLGILCADSPLENKAVDLLCALEILHLATLVHDDVIDDAPTRRGLPSVHEKFGKKTAVLSGDYLFTICFKLLADKNTDKIGEFAKALSFVCMGEITQLKNNMNLEISVKDYLRTISGKTAALFSMAAVAGADNNNYTEDELKKFAKVGYRIGMLFQITDDYLDYQVSSEEAGKKTLKDLEEGVVTLPLIMAIRENPEIKTALKSTFVCKSDIPQVYKMVIQSNGIKKSKEFTDKYYAKTIREINKLPKYANKTSLIEFTDKIMSRKK